MNQKLWRAQLNPKSPRYLEWRKIFESDEIPLVTPSAFDAQLGNETDSIHLLDWFEIVSETSDRMLEYFAAKFGTTIEEVEKEFDETGHIPIRASDVIVSYDVRAFI